MRLDSVKAKSDLTHHTRQSYSSPCMSNRFPTRKVAIRRAGRALELVRIERGYTSAAAADAVGWSLGRLAEVEAGGRNVTWLDVLELLTALGAGIDDLTAAWSEVGESRQRSTSQRIEGR